MSTGHFHFSGRARQGEQERRRRKRMVYWTRQHSHLTWQEELCNCQIELLIVGHPSFVFLSLKNVQSMSIRSEAVVIARLMLRVDQWVCLSSASRSDWRWWLTENIDDRFTSECESVRQKKTANVSFIASLKYLDLLHRWREIDQLKSWVFVFIC